MSQLVHRITAPGRMCRMARMARGRNHQLGRGIHHTGQGLSRLLEAEFRQVRHLHCPVCPISQIICRTRDSPIWPMKLLWNPSMMREASSRKPLNLLQCHHQGESRPQNYSSDVTDTMF